MICRKLLLASLALILFSHSVVSLSVPTYISFQGKLSNSSSGDPYYPASLRVNITNQTELDQVEWGPYVFADATDSQGVFDIILGAADQLNLTPGWQYQLVVEVDLDSSTFSTTDLSFGDLNPAGDSILVTGGGPATAAQLLMTDNSTTVQVHDHSGGGAGVTVLGPSSGWLNVSDDFGVGGDFTVDGQNLYLRHTDFTNCGKLYTVSNQIACGVDATGGAGSADIPYWIDVNSVITSNASINQGNVNVTGNLSISDRLMGAGGIASGKDAIAWGSASTATGDYSIAMGYDVQATATGAFVFGDSISNSESYSIAFGIASTALIINETKVVIQDDKVLCFDTDCTVCQYYNNTHLVTESPCTK